MGLFDFLFSSGVSNSQKKTHRNASNNTSSDHENYARGYDDCCCDHDCSYDDYHNRGYCDHDEYEGIENDDCYDDNCGW